MRCWASSIRGHRYRSNNNVCRTQRKPVERTLMSISLGTHLQNEEGIRCWRGSSVLRHRAHWCGKQAERVVFQSVSDWCVLSHSRRIRDHLALSRTPPFRSWPMASPRDTWLACVGIRRQPTPWRRAWETAREDYACSPCSPGLRISFSGGPDSGRLRKNGPTVANVGKSLVPYRCAAVGWELCLRRKTVGDNRPGSQPNQCNCCLCLAMRFWSVSYFLQIPNGLFVSDSGDLICSCFSPFCWTGCFRDFWHVLSTGWGHTDILVWNFQLTALQPGFASGRGKPVIFYELQ